MAKVLRKSPLFLNESVYTDELEKQEKHVLEQYALGLWLKGTTVFSPAI